MKAVLLAFQALAAVTLVSSARTFTVVNKCGYTVWPALYTDPASPGVPDHATGWEAPSGHSTSFLVPDNWKSGRIWGRTGCDFSNPDGATACKTGGCNGGLECQKGGGGTGVPPVSLAEWTLSADSNLDWYDVSLVDGANIPMGITNNKGCAESSCPADLNQGCPAEIALLKDGATVGCKSSCLANLDLTPANSLNCCSGSFNTPATCPPSSVKHYDHFKKGCPLAYAYAYDESSGTALFTCPSDQRPDYTLTFCP